MKCKRCNNEDPAYFYKGSKGYYCRKCIRFKRLLAYEDVDIVFYDVQKREEEIHWRYALTPPQKEISSKLLTLIQSQDVLLHCVTGAGKTELVIETIQSYLEKGKRVCYGISRKEVVIDLYPRFQSFFKKSKVVAVYGGHSEEVYGDLIICTTHQLYRYYKCFDLLILDEVDAYPFKGNDTLFEIAKNTCIGHIIYSTATLDESLNLKAKRLSLNVRPHGHPLVEPKVIYAPIMILLVILYKKLKDLKGPCIIFVPTRQLCKQLQMLYQFFFDCRYVHSESKERQKIIQDFKDGCFNVLFATSLLERGVTIENVQVIVLFFKREIFDTASLIQMVGRVGRSFKYPKGEAYILSCFYDQAIKRCLNEIKKANLEGQALSLL